MSVFAIQRACLVLACHLWPLTAPAARTLQAPDSGADAIRSEAELEPVQSSTPGNILILLADDLGVDKLGCYGESSAAPATPNIDRLASEGILFRRAYAMPNCSPTRAAVLTGRYGRRTGVGTIMARAREEELGLDERTLAEALGEVGAGSYSSAAIGKWHLSTFLSPSGSAHPLLQGFDHYTGALLNLRDEEDYFGWNQVMPDGSTAAQAGYITTREVDDALALLKKLPEPWFVYLAFHAPHIPVHVPPSHLHSRSLTNRSSRRDKHDAAVEAMDSEIGRLLKGMDAKLLNRTNVIFFGDNGTMRGAALPNADPDRSKGSLYEGGIRVPLIVRGPAVAVANSESGALVHAVDLFPTLLELSGLSTGAGDNAHGSNNAELNSLTLDGLSLVAILGDPTHKVRDFLYTESFEPNGVGPFTEDGVVMRGERYKLMRLNGRDHLFDLNGGGDDGEDLLTEGRLAQSATVEVSNAYRQLKSALESQMRSFGNE